MTRRQRNVYGCGEIHMYSEAGEGLARVRLEGRSGV